MQVDPLILDSKYSSDRECSSSSSVDGSHDSFAQGNNNYANKK